MRGGEGVEMSGGEGKIERDGGRITAEERRRRENNEERKI